MLVALKILAIAGILLVLLSYGIRVYIFQRLRNDLHVGGIIKDTHVLSFTDFLSLHLLSKRRFLKGNNRLIVNVFIGSQLLGLICIIIFGLSYLFGPNS